MSTREWYDDAFDEKPSAARIYDYFLGGYHNFESDRRAAREMLQITPDAQGIMRANRAFLRRVTTFLARQGMDQFLDIGSGIPTAGNVHEIVWRQRPDAHVVYVDSDPIAVQHGLSILKGAPHVTAIRADVRQPETILTHPDVTRLVDFSRPMAVLLVAVLHFVIDDDDAYRAVRVLREALAPGSYIAVSHATYEHMRQQDVDVRVNLYKRTANPGCYRSRAQIERFFEGLDVEEPGLVYAPLWRPESEDDVFLREPERSTVLACVGRKV